MEGPTDDRGGRTLTARRAIALAAIATLLIALSPSTAASADVDEVCLTIPGLENAPELSDDLTPDGSVVQETPLFDGSYVPVLMVHGWTGRSIHSPERDGAFSSKIDLSANPVAELDAARSLIGQTQDIPGTRVYTFDYHDAAARWVDDPQIAPRLAEAISCLFAAHNHKVIVVAHSMGGLATRDALARIEAEGHAAGERVSDVITFGTPNTGSWAAAVSAGAVELGSVFPTAPGSAIISLRALLTVCGISTTASLEHAGACGLLPGAFSSFDSEAGRALRMGSAEIGRLASWPDDVTVHSLAGDIGLEFVDVSWFGLRRNAGRIATGDFIVTKDSADSGADTTASATCDYTLNVATATTDNFLEAFQLRAASETRDNAYTNLTAGACFHVNLMRSVELANAELSIVAERLEQVANGSFFIGSTEFVRIDPWSSAEADKPIVGEISLDDNACYQATSYRTDFLRCSAGMMCFVSPEQTEALCGGNLGRLDRFIALDVSATRRFGQGDDSDLSTVARITPVEFETVTAEICRPRWTGTGLFGPEPLGATAAYCTAVDDRGGEATSVVWGSEAGWESEFGGLFAAPDDAGYLRAALSDTGSLNEGVVGDQYSGAYEYVGVTAVYY